MVLKRPIASKIVHHFQATDIYKGPHRTGTMKRNDIYIFFLHKKKL